MSLTRNSIRHHRVTPFTSSNSDVSVYTLMKLLGHESMATSRAVRRGRRTRNPRRRGTKSAFTHLFAIAGGHRTQLTATGTCKRPEPAQKAARVGIGGRCPVMRLRQGRPSAMEPAKPKHRRDGRPKGTRRPNGLLVQRFLPTVDESSNAAAVVCAMSPYAPPLIDLLHVLSKDELVHAGHGEAQHAAFGRVDQALLNEFVAGDRQVAGARFVHARCQGGHCRRPVAG
jgi:hypothetical protein